MYESLIIAPPMFCCGYHKQPILVVLNRNTNRSEVFREPMALTANLAAIWPWPATTADALYRPDLSIGEGHWPASGPCRHSGIAAAGVGNRARSPSALDFPCTKSDAAWRDVAIHVIAPAQEDDTVTSRI